MREAPTLQNALMLLAGHIYHIASDMNRDAKGKGRPTSFGLGLDGLGASVYVHVHIRPHDGPASFDEVSEAEASARRGARDDPTSLFAGRWSFRRWHGAPIRGRARKRASEP